jgi:hypothetical protein
MRLRHLTFFATSIALACQHEKSDVAAGHALASAIKDSIGAKGDPSVSLLMHGNKRNLQVQFDTTAFADMSRASFQVRARDIAQLSLRHYTADPGDSVIVLARNLEQPGVWRIVRRASFARADLIRTP